VRAQCRQVVSQTGGSAGELRLQAADEGSQALLGVSPVFGIVEGGPVGLANLLVQRRTLGQLGEYVFEPMDGTPLTIGLWPQLTDGPHQTRRTVGHHQPRRPESALGETATQLQPILIALPLAQADVEQDALTIDGIPPHNQHALLGAPLGRAGR